MKGKILVRVIYFSLILGCVGFYAYNIIVNKADPIEDLGKLMIIIVGAIIGIIRIETRYGITKLADYEESYATVIEGAFSYDKNARKQLIYAIRYFDAGKYKKAIKSLRKLKGKCQRSEDYRCVGTLLAICYSNIYLYSAAIKEYEELLSKQIESGRIYNNLAKIYSNIGKKDEAMQCYKTAMSYFPNYEYSFINAANSCFEDKDYDTAIEYALKALDINKKLPMASNLLTIIYALQEEEEKMDKYFRISIANGVHVEELQQAIEYYLSERDEETDDEE